jgi:hypothetical protein
VSKVTLQQFKANLMFEAQDIEKKLDRGQNTPENIQRLEKINEMLAVINTVEKPDSIFKKALNL